MARGTDDRDKTQRIAGHRGERPPDLLAAGSVVGDYRIVELIAVGGFGAVYRAQHVQHGHEVALKLLHRELTTSQEAVLRFEREAEAVTTIRHANVIDIIDHGSHEETPYFVMELLTGRDLKARIEEHGRLTLEETLRILEPLCSALSAAHARGIVHRDIKASNVFLHDSADGLRVVLLDFGVAKLLDADSTSLTTSRHAIGTPACMAPEQIVGGEITIRTDVYGLAVLAYHMITGLLPFAGASMTMMQHMHLDAERPRASAIVPGAAAVDAVLAKAMSRQPAQRYATVMDLFDALRAAVLPRADVDAAPSAPAVGVLVTIHAAADLLEAPDARLLDEIETIAAAAADALEPRGFARQLDTATRALYVRRRAAEREAAEDLREVREVIDALLASLDARPDRDDRVTLLVALRTATVRELDELVSWPADELASRVRVID